MTEPTKSDGAIERRSFLQLMGVTALSSMGHACSAEEGTPGMGPAQLRVGLHQLAFSTSINVVRAKDQLVVDEAEHMTVDPSVLTMLSVGDQVRVIRSADDYAIYTVAAFHVDQNEDDASMGLPARLRLGTGESFPATLSTAVVAANLTDEEAQAQSELVERLVDDGTNTGLCVIAPHGGWIEPYTDLQAERLTTTLAAKGPSSWICKGYLLGGGAYDRWHITSIDLSPNSFAGLNAIAGRGFAYCVSFHGMSLDGILVGGGAPLVVRSAVRDAIAAALADTGINVYLAVPADAYSGDSPSNVVNWLTVNGAGGIQIEQSLPAREGYWEAIADAVAGVLDPLL